jgi:ornithine decarboxylase
MNTTTTVTALSLRQPCDPAVLYRPHALATASKYFQDHFHARLLYAVKTNPDPVVLADLYAAGLRSFDVASLEEAKDLSQRFPDATLFYMHPVKPRHAIASAYRDFGVRHFSLDSKAELQKILKETGYAKDLSLHVRLAMPNSYSEITLANKFGVALHDAAALIAVVSEHAAEVGVSFHVGSQCMNPDAYRIAIRMCRTVLDDLPKLPLYFNVGGGFPSIYPDLTPPDLHLYFDAIHEEFSHLPGHESMTLLAEPGRALVAESGSVLVRVDMRRGDTLYINDGTYGSLFDAGQPGFLFPTKLHRSSLRVPKPETSFRFYGPTCDSMDVMEGPFMLPDDVEEGDYIEIGQLGAYGRTMATKFNGFTQDPVLYAVADAPLLTLYPKETVPQEQTRKPLAFFGKKW